MCIVDKLRPIVYTFISFTVTTLGLGCSKIINKLSKEKVSHEAATDRV